MADQTKIEWTDATWNVINGCTLVSEGCRNCYAAKLAATRLKNHPTRKGLARINADSVAKFTGEVRFNEKVLTDPLRWRRPRMVFVCAHGDLFHEDLPDEVIDQVFAVMALCPQHTFQVLTKRPERMRGYVSRFLDEKKRWERLGDAGVPVAGNIAYEASECAWPLPNVWLGTSVEDQATANARIPHLLETPAAVRFISAEPLLGPVDVARWLSIRWQCSSCRGYFSGGHQQVCPDCGAIGGWTGSHVFNGRGRPEHPVVPPQSGRGLDWVICGGESGPGARPMHPDWARSLRDQCAAAGVPFFFKQWGAWLPGEFGPPPDIAFQDGSWMDANLLPDIDCDDGWCEEWSTDDFDGHCVFKRVSKKAAGRLLDGVTHDGMPETANG